MLMDSQFHRYRKRLEDSRKLWQFYWDMADEENWIKEKEQIVSVDDIGHDLSTGESLNYITHS